MKKLKCYACEIQHHYNTDFTANPLANEIDETIDARCVGTSFFYIPPDACRLRVESFFVNPGQKLPEVVVISPPPDVEVKLEIKGRFPNMQIHMWGRGGDHA